MNGNRLRQELSDTKAAGKIAVAIGIYDARTAQIFLDVLEEMEHKREIPSNVGFVIPFISGYQVSADMEYPDVGIIDRTIMRQRSEQVRGALGNYPFGVDVDTGFGHSSKSMEVTAYWMHKAGASYVQLEDQDGDKTCGHKNGYDGKGKLVLPADNFADIKLKPMIDYGRVGAKGDLMVMARTDSLNGLGLEDAMERARLYSRRGAELIFVESPLNDDQLVVIAEGFKNYKDRFNLANMIEGSPKTPYHNHQELNEMGFDIALYCVGLWHTHVYNGTQEHKYIKTILSGKDPVKEGILPSDVFARHHVHIGADAAENFNRRYMDEHRHNKGIDPKNFLLV